MMKRRMVERQKKNDSKTNKGWIEDKMVDRQKWEDEKKNGMTKKNDEKKEERQKRDGVIGERIWRKKTKEKDILYY